MKQKFFCVAVIIGLMALPLALSAHSINNRVNPDGTPVIVPTVQRYEARQGVLPLPAELTVSAPAAADNEAELFLKLSKRYFPDRRAVRVKNGAFCRLELVTSGVPENDEGYTLEINDSGVVIRSRAAHGLFYGVHTLGNMFRNVQKAGLGKCLITDWPDLKLRAVYFERVVTADRSNMKRLLREFDLIGSLKYNAIQLELAEFFPYKKNPFTRRTGEFLPEDVEALKAAAKRNHLEIIPYLKIISHDKWMQAHPRYWTDIAEGIPHESAWATASCPLRPLPKEIYRMAIREHVECFKPRFFFIGLDEVAQCPWGVCELCRKHTKHDLLRLITLEYTKEVLQYGVAPVIDFDQYYPGLPMKGELILPEVDRRVVICNWDYAEVLKPQRFSYFKELGFPVWGASAATRANNLKTAPVMTKKMGCDSLIVTFWGNWRKLDDPMRVTPGGLAGFINGSNYAWNTNAPAPSGQSFDPALETLRIYAPELVVDADKYTYTALPIDGAFNAKLGREAGFPLLNGELAATIKKELAGTHEKFHFATTADGGYFAVKAGAGKGEEKSPKISLGGIKAEALSLLITAGSLGDSPKKYDRSKIGTLKFNYTDGSREEIPLNLTINMNHWNATESGFYLRFANRFNDTRGALAALFAFDWKNPNPDRNIDSVTIEADGVYEIPIAVFAVSAGNCRQPVSAEFDEGDRRAAKRLTGWSRGYFESIKDAKGGSDNEIVIFSLENGIPAKPRIGLAVKSKGRLGKRVENDPTAPVPGAVLRCDIPANADGVKQRQRITIDIPIDLSSCKKEVKSLVFDYKFDDVKTISNPGCYIAEAGGRSLTRIPFWDQKSESGKWYTAKVAIDRMRREGGGDFPVSTANRVRLSVFFFPLQKPTTVWFGPVRLATERQNDAPMIRIEKIQTEATENVLPAKAVKI